ncbi:hypothetical protein U9M48_021700 [Paspalum notatum var. saurae]|uniref:Uncharacterized protein n=1 Tax=Paspalum notatum var. saurae TaxID=547442 RepID=A0AAQ3TK68_PASNO
MPCDVGASVDLWAMAAELERQFAGYKQRLAERNGGAVLVHGDDDDDDDAAAAAAYDDDEEEEEEAGGLGGGDVRGRMYEAYVRRRDERLRESWRARMERKEAEVKALWAQLELTARAGAERAQPAAPAGDEDGGGAVVGDDERKTVRNDDDKRRSSDAALAPRRITGKKHARTRSFSSSIATSRDRADVGRRRALSQEPPPAPSPEPQPKKDKRVRPGGGVATPAAAPARPRTSLRRKSSVKGHGTANKPAAAPKLPRSLPRRASSGSLEDLASGSETPKDSPPRTTFVVEDDGGGGTGAANTRATSPESDRGEVVEAAPDGEPEAGNADVEERGEEKVVDVSPYKPDNSNGEITSDSETEPSYVYVNKDTAEEQAMSGALKSSALDGALDSGDPKTKEENADEVPAPRAEDTSAEVATMNAEEAPARESSDESSFSVRSGQSARPSCSSRDQSIERLLEEDAVLVRKKREEQRAEKSAPKTPGSAGSRFSGTAARSPRDTVRGFKRFLSFGKKNRGREVTVIDCTSPSVPSLADDDSASGGWQSAGSIKPRMGSSDAASDDTDHGYPASPRADGSLQSLVAASPAKSELAEIVPQEKSPKAHRSFFSFRSLNCGRR